MATHSSIVAWRILWTKEPGGLRFIRLQESDTVEATEHNGLLVEEELCCLLNVVIDSAGQLTTSKI